MTAYPNSKTVPNRKQRKSERNKIFQLNKQALREQRKARKLKGLEETAL